MPNYVNGSYAIKGKKENVLEFLNEGLRNSKLPIQKTCEEAFHLLCEHGKTKYSKGENFTINKKEIVWENNVTLDTFRPMPDTFLQWDTTNHEKELKKVARYQKRKYGVVGWYDYGCNVLRGTKWNAKLENFNLSYVDDETAMIEFACDTAWSYPYLWLEWVKKTFKVNVLLCVHEESNAFNFFGEIDHEEKDFDDLMETSNLKEEDFEDVEDYYNAIYEEEENMLIEMQEEYANYIKAFEIEDLGL